MNKLKYLLVILLAAIVQTVSAQDYNPDFPDEPNAMTHVTVSCSPAAAGYVSGTGWFSLGTQTTIRTSANANYKFVKWTLNGEDYSTEQSFTYSVTSETAKFVAVYEYQEPETPVDPTFDPDFPDEPSEQDPIVVVKKYTLTLSSNPSGACSFNTGSGQSHAGGESVTLRAYPNQDYSLLGWYDGDKIVSDQLEFTYVTQKKNTTLVARFSYSPSFPDEPEEPEVEPEDPDIDNTETGLLGDANDDGLITTADAVFIIGKYLVGDPNGELKLSRCDFNQDGVVNTADAVAIINYYLKH